MLEELLLQKVVVEAARYHRVLGFEQQFTGSPIHVVACYVANYNWSRFANMCRTRLALIRLLRYETTLERAIERLLNQLERLQRMRLSQPAPPPISLDVSSS